tara:strand:- start:157 stop:411 length:255 start_codon:yes stop_codon:yes gene_type:complete
MEKRTRKELKVNEMSDMDVDTARLIIYKLETIFGLSDEEALQTEPLITEESLHSLESVITDLLNLKDAHHKYLIRWLKQGYLLD